MNEVSCRALEVFFIALGAKGVPLDALVKGVPYSVSHLQNKKERIDWDTYIQILANADAIWTEPEFEDIGALVSQSPFIRPFSFIAGTFLSAKSCYRWAYSPKHGAGAQLFSCITPDFEEITRDLIRLSITVDEGYQVLPRKFLALCKGTLSQLTRLVGLEPAKVEITELPRGGQFLVQIPQKTGFLHRARRMVAWPLHVLVRGEEFKKEVNEVLQERYDQLRKAHDLLDRQTTALRTAHAINGLVQGELQLDSTMQTVVEAMVQVGGFRRAKVNVDTTVGGEATHLTAQHGATLDGAEPTVFPLAIGDRSLGELHLWPTNDKLDWRKELTDYVTPAVTMAIDDALKYTALLELQDTLESKVVARTAELERVRDELTHAVGELKKTKAARDRLFANISHEFRTPLTLIKGPIEQLIAGELKGSEQEQYHLIRRNCLRLLRLVNQLLDLSKIESGEMKLHMVEIDIVTLVRGVAAAFESTAKHRGMEFNLSVPGSPIAGWFDKDCVEKILTNLLSNAFKFTPDSREVVISVAREAAIPDYPERQACLISVSDSGIGIPADKLERIFDRFYQIDASQTREQEGTGIGLALTKELVELHEGTITVTSRPNEGSTFVVRLPLGKEHLGQEAFHVTGGEFGARTDGMVDTGGPSRAPIEVQVAQVDQTFPLLLIIEDNGDLRKHMRGYLAAGYRLLESVDGEEGIQMAKDSVPDIVVSDVMMPKMDGFTVCRILKTDEKTSHIPIILLTAKAGIEHKMNGLETGADDYITKPFDARELLSRVRNLIEQRRKLREKFRREGFIQLREISVTSADERYLKRAVETVETRIHDQNFTTDEFARQMFMSRMQLHRKIRALTDLSPGEFVRKIRMEKAARLLRCRAGTIAEIAYQVGYESASRFAVAFRLQFGVLPSEFIKQQSQKT